MHKIQVDIQDLRCLRTEVIDAHSHGVYKGMKYVEHLCSNTCGGLRSALRNIYSLLDSHFYTLSNKIKILIM